MNIQTERLENHTARFTVEVDAARLDKAKQSAARKIAQKVNIPGFRRGKAPYKILVNYVGEATILDEAVEELGNQIYQEALNEAELDPFGPGALDDFKLEPTPIFTFTVPLQPTVELGDYRAVRLDYSAPEVEDEAVTRAMKMLQESRAVVEESHQPAALANRITADIHSYFLDKPASEIEAVAEAEGEASTEEHDHEHEHGEDEAHDHEAHDHEHGADGEGIHAHMHDDQEIFIHEHAFVATLSDDDDEVAPGFSQAIVGANLDEEREFELTFPTDNDKYKDVAGRKVKFHVVVKKIETMTLPALNDDFAAKVTETEEKPLTLLELRMRVRENLQRESERQSKTDFANSALQKMMEMATVSYPEALVAQQVETLLEDVDRRLRQQGLTLEDYMKVSNKTKENLYEDYRETAERVIERSLVLMEVMQAEHLQVTSESIDAQIDMMVAQFGDQAAAIRKAVDTPSMRSNVATDLLQQVALDRVAEIAMGTAPEITADTEDEGEEEDAAVAEVPEIPAQAETPVESDGTAE